MSTATTEDTKEITKVILDTKYLHIEITDPNILDELNKPGKYAQNILFKALTININKMGGRVLLLTEDRKEVLREIASGVSTSDMQSAEHEYFKIER